MVQSASLKILILLILANMCSSIAISIGMFVVPWYLTVGTESPQWLAVMSTIASILVVVISPSIGVLIDRVNRKRIIVGITACVLALFAACAFFSGTQEGTVVALSLAYLVLQLFFAVFFITRQALIKDIFNESYMNKANSLLEMESQASTMIASLVVILPFKYVPTTYIFISLCLMLSMALIFLSLIPYTQQQREKVKEVKLRITHFDRTLLRNLGLLILSSIPFIALMTINVVLPSYIHDILQATLSTYVLADLLYGLGAIVVSVALTLFWNGNARSRVVVFTSGYALVAFMIMCQPSVYMIISMSFLLGIGNAGARICGQRAILNSVESKYIGRVFAYGQTGTLMARIAATGFLPIIFYDGYENVWVYIFFISGLAPLCFALIYLKKGGRPTSP